MALLTRARQNRATPSRRGGVLALLLLLLVAGCPGSARAAGGPAGLGEAEVRAGFVYNFARFTDWPPGALPASGQPFVIAVLGDPDLARALASGLAGKTLSGHPLAVREARDPAGIDGAHLVWIGRGWRAPLARVLGRLGTRPVLTVSDIPGFAGAGGVIELYRVGSRFRFTIDERAAARRGLRLSSRLLSLARPRPAAAVPREVAR